MPRTRSKRRKRSSSKGSNNDSEHAPAASAPPTRGPLSFDKFLAMPEEIRTLVLDLAFQLSFSTIEGKVNGARSIDIVTTLNLALTSRWFYARSVCFLYRDIKVTRVSALTSLQRAVASRPQLGRIIKSLHVGPEHEPPKYDTPIFWRPDYHDAQGIYHPPVPLFQASLRGAEAAKLFPRWWKEEHEWSHEEQGSNAKSIAIVNALREIVRSIGNTFGFDIHNTPQWCQLVPAAFEAQAALDLYLMEMRRLEDSHDLTSPSSRTQGITAPNYPQLVLIGTRLQPTLPEGIDPGAVFIISRQEALQHLSRPGCPTDCLDHPLLLTRSGLVPSADGETATTRREEPPINYTLSPEDIADSFSSQGVQPAAALPGPLDLLDPALLDAPTTGSVLATLRCLLTLTPGLENLALTGFLERAICGSRSSGALLQSLRSLSLGPPPAVQKWFMPMSLRRLKSIAKLRICGINLRGNEAAAATSLRRDIQWTMPDDLNGKDLLRLGVIIDLLVGRKGVAADAALRELGFEELDELRLPFTYSAAKEDESDDEDIRCPARLKGLVEIRLRLRPVVLKAMLNRASSLEEGADWVKGRARPNQQQRLLLTELSTKGEAGVATSKALRQAMYDEGREWWEKYCKAEERKNIFDRRHAYY